MIGKTTNRLLICMFLMLPTAALSDPVITGIDGTITSGGTVTLTGTDFEAEDTTDYLVYDNYDDSTYWPATGYDGVPLAFTYWDGKVPANTWSSYATTYWLARVWSEQGDSEDPASFQVTTNAAQYSTGFGWRKYIRRISSTVGVEGLSLLAQLGEENEVWIRYYQRWDVDMSDRGHESKQMYVYFGTATSHPEGYLMPHMHAGSSGDGFAWATYLDAKCLYNNTLSADNCYNHRHSYPGKDKWQEIKLRVVITPTASDTYQEWYDGTQFVDYTGDISDTGVGDIRFGANFSVGTTDFLSVGESLNEDRTNIVISTTDPGSIPKIYLSNSASWGTGPTDVNNGDSTFVRQTVGGSGSTEKGFQAWSDTETKFEIDLNGLDSEQDIYIYVTNWSSETNTTGELLVAGATPTAGVCGSAEDTPVVDACPSTNLCDTGTASAVTSDSDSCDWICTEDTAVNCTVAYSETPSAEVTAVYSLLDGSVIPYKLTTE